MVINGSTAMERISATIPNSGRFIDRHTIAFTRRLSAPIEHVWKAYTEKEETAQWWWTTDIDLHEGGRFSFGWNAGTISDFNPPYSIQFNYDGGDGHTRIELEPDGEGTIHSLIDRFPSSVIHPNYKHPGGPGTHYPEVVGCWHAGVDGLQEYLEGTPRPIDVDGLIERYCAVLTAEYYAEHFDGSIKRCSSFWRTKATLSAGV